MKKDYHGRVIDLIGQEFGWLKVVRFSHSDYRAYWVCKCKCGKEVIKHSNHLRSGNTKSCGCYKIVQIKKANTKNLAHGTKLYMIWGGIKQRALNKKNSRYKKYYSEVGMCKEWEEYLAFERWALKNGYKEGLQIDRINNKGNYCPENCQWLTASSHAKKSNEARWSNRRVATV